MSPILSFELPGLPKTTNSGGRTHWAVKVKEASRWKRAVAFQCFNILGAMAQESRDQYGNAKFKPTNPQMLPAFPLKKARLVLTRCSSVEPDGDGVASSFKHIVDGLVEAGILADDKISNIGVPEYRWEKVKPKQGKVRVEVYAVTAANEAINQETALNSLI